MIRITVQLYEEQFDAARAQARLEGLSLAGYVRHAVDLRLARSESLVRMVRHRALAAVDRIEPESLPTSASGSVSGSATGSGGRRGGESGERRVPRYWLDDE